MPRSARRAARMVLMVMISDDDKEAVMKFRPRGVCGRLPGACLLIVVTIVATTLGLGAEERYDNPVVFQRAHLDETTGESTARASEESTILSLSEYASAHSSTQIWVMDADGSGLRQLTSGTKYNDHPSFYADQEHVLFAEFETNVLDRTANARLIKQNIYTGHRETVAAEDGCALHHATLSPIDDLLAYHRDCGGRHSQWAGFGEGAYEVPLLASNGLRTPTGLIAMHEKNVGISPREVALVSITGHGAGSTVRLLTDDTALNRRAAISPDARWLAWQTNMEGQGDEIYLANIDGSEARNLTKTPGNDGHPWFSRDGSFIVFESDRTGSWEIWRLDLATGAQRQLTFGGSRYASTRARM